MAFRWQLKHQCYCEDTGSHSTGKGASFWWPGWDRREDPAFSPQDGMCRNGFTHHHHLIPSLPGLPGTKRSSWQKENLAKLETG